ncbi:MAG: ABC transporter ATP-binding protein [Lachnospiraceae bacterium]|nr:ABC transporter ATP-binding protein [Lachnospiraceae bacterium]
MEFISAQNIQSAYGRHQVLRNVTFSVDRGDCVAILGANGCGKTTLLSILAGLRMPKGGKLFLEERAVDTKAKRDTYQRRVGYVPQESILIPELTVWDNLLLWYVDEQALRKELQEGFLHELGLDQMLSKKVNTLSGGMHKRVSIGVALANYPEVLILDEPSAALDLPGKKEMRAYLGKFKALGGTIILATHDELELDLCNKLFLLKEGECQALQSNLRGEELAYQMQ